MGEKLVKNLSFETRLMPFACIQLLKQDQPPRRGTYFTIVNMSDKKKWFLLTVVASKHNIVKNPIHYQEVVSKAIIRYFELIIDAKRNLKEHFTMRRRRQERLVYF